MRVAFDLCLVFKRSLAKKTLVFWCAAPPPPTQKPGFSDLEKPLVQLDSDQLLLKCLRLGLPDLANKLLEPIVGCLWNISLQLAQRGCFTRFSF
jgi:hypothetical protein